MYHWSRCGYFHGIPGYIFTDINNTCSLIFNFHWYTTKAEAVTLTVHLVHAPRFCRSGPGLYVRYTWSMLRGFVGVALGLYVCFYYFMWIIVLVIFIIVFVCLMCLNRETWRLSTSLNGRLMVHSLSKFCMADSIVKIKTISIFYYYK